MSIWRSSERLEGEAATPAPNQEVAINPLHLGYAGGQKRADIGYIEESIQERDPAYREGASTLHDEQTVDELSAEMRLTLVGQRVALGMSPPCAAMMASL